MIKCDKCGSTAENPVENEDGTITYFCTNRDCEIKGIPVIQGCKILKKEVDSE
jgi:hypothetical protein